MRIVAGLASFRANRMPSRLGESEPNRRNLFEAAPSPTVPTEIADRRLYQVKEGRTDRVVG